MDDPRMKADGARAVALTETPRDADMDDSYHHLRAKFVHHDIDEGDEDAEEEDEVTRRANGRRLRQHHARTNEKTNASVSRGREAATTDTSIARMLLSGTAAVGSVAELCQYIQKLEAEKRDLVDQVHFLRDQDATHKVHHAAAARRLEKLEALLQHASEASDTQQQVQLQVEAAIAGEQEKTIAMGRRLESMQRKYEDAERARQHAVFKLSELQTTMAEAATNRLITPPHARMLSGSRPGSAGNADAVDPTTGSNERMEKYKREIELLRQKLEMREHQAHEKQKLAVDLALRSAHLEHTAMLEKVKLECEIKLSEWRHDEAVRAKEVEAAMEEDRYSVRLEMRHGMQRAQIEQRVYYLQAQAAIAQTPSAAAASPSHGDDTEVPFSAMDEVLVRMQLELLRTRRFAGLKKLLAIRQAVVGRAARRALAKWKTVASQAKLTQRHAVLHMHRIVSHFERQDLRASFQNWKMQSQLIHAEAQRQQAASCWNRMVAVERMVHVLQQRTVKQLSRCFHRWQLHLATATSGGSSSRSAPSPLPSAARLAAVPSPPVSADAPAVGAELQDEIRKLHEQLASSKSEAWRYKRQLLKQFL